MRTVTDDNYLEPAAWFAQLPTVYLAAAALITNPQGQVLLVKPNYRDYWNLPGGIVEDAEDPYDGCAREVREEIGLAVAIGALLVADWVPPRGERPRPILCMVFDGGILASDEGIVIQREELDGYMFTDAADVGSYLPPHIAARVPAAMSARRTGGASYLPLTAGS
jgi:8-oxo-dGTP diphosphatase